MAEGGRRLGDRLASARRRGFVGREAEVELVRRALAADEPDLALLWVHGPGGVGKSTLLRRLADLGSEYGRTTVLLDGRDLVPDPAALAAAAAPALADEPVLLLVDTAERLAPLESFLREDLLPRLADGSLIVVAGRHAPDPSWRTDPGWSDLTRVVTLRNLPPDDADRYLVLRGVVDDALRAEGLRITHGQPLALALLADVLAQGGSIALDDPVVHDVLGTLLERFASDAPTPRHREALDVVAMARATTPPLLADVLGVADQADDLFAWLDSLSFVQRVTDGIAPHDLAREVLRGDLRWRDPERFVHLHRSIGRSLRRRFVAAADNGTRFRLMADMVYLNRESPVMGAVFAFDVERTMWSEPARAADVDQLLDIIETVEGPAGRDVAERWVRAQPDALVAIRQGRGDLVGYALFIALRTEDDLAAVADPIAEAVWRRLVPGAPMRDGEYLRILRTWGHVEEGISPVGELHNVVASVCAVEWFTQKRLTWWAGLGIRPDVFAPMFDLMGFMPLGPVGEVGGVTYAGYANDFREHTWESWLRLLGRRQLEGMVGAAPPPPVEPPRITLSQPEFEEAVRVALKEAARPARLAGSPLLRSRVLQDEAHRSGHASDPTLLRDLLAATVSAELGGDPRDERALRAVTVTYLAPAITQEAAAERLGLPFSTYRRHLRLGVDRVVAALWNREVHGDPAPSEGVDAGGTGAR